MVKKRGLGKSLDALLMGSSSVAEESEHEAGQTKEKLCQLSVALIQSGKYQPRRDMSPEGLEDLANSIRVQGIIQPIIVRYLPNGRYEIVAGERRWRAAQSIGLTEIPAIVRDIPDEAAVAIALIENIQRENLNPIEEAMALQRLLDEFSMTHHQVAEAVGKSRTSVTNLLRLLTLMDEVKAMLEHGDLEMGHARALLTLSPDLQVDIARAVADKRLSVRETENLVQRLQTTKLPSAMKSMDPDVLRLQESLSKWLKLSVTVKHTAKGTGKLIITYKNLAELDALLEHLQ
jgi:ParB family chromosome partitioning protein